jgi:hypothetical protein
VRFRSGRNSPLQKVLESSAADGAHFLFYILGRVKGLASRRCFSSVRHYNDQCIMAEQVKEWFGLGELSAHANVPRNHLLIVVKSYFDGGNQADSRKYQILTLAALAGTKNAWDKLDPAWQKVMRKHGAPYLHTTDAVSLAKPFSRNQGWSDEKVNLLISDCATLMEQCKGWGIRPISVSVILRDYKNVLSRIPDLPAVELICAIQCVGLALIFGQAHLHDPKAELFFDRSEPFCGHVLDRWNNKKVTRTNDTWKSIVQVGQVDSRNVPALQAADLLAWSVNRAHEDNAIRYYWQERVLNVPRSKDWLDEERLSKPNLEAMAVLKQLRLPVRKKMR